MDAFDVFCMRLSTAIKESGYTRAELADRLGLKPATIKSWCVGRRSPTVRRLLELTALLDIDAPELFQTPESLPTLLECPACGQRFRREVGYRIHLALKAKECPEHERFHQRA